MCLPEGRTEAARVTAVPMGPGGVQKASIRGDIPGKAGRGIKSSHLTVPRPSWRSSTQHLQCSLPAPVLQLQDPNRPMEPSRSLQGAWAVERMGTKEADGRVENEGQAEWTSSRRQA
jgi:hypothetical protein